MKITNRAGLIAMPIGATGTDKDGWPIQKASSTGFAAQEQEGKKRWLHYDLDEIAGDYDENDESHFLPIKLDPAWNPVIKALTARLIAAEASLELAVSSLVTQPGHAFTIIGRDINEAYWILANHEEHLDSDVQQNFRDQIEALEARLPVHI